MPTIRLSSEPDASPDDVQGIEDQINNFNMRVTGYADFYPVNIFLRDENGVLRGGITAGVWGGWLDIYFLWVDADLRKHSYGAQLLAAAEDEARRYGCRNVHVSTHSFQARPFYERYGYQVIATMDDFPLGHAHYHLRKSLE
jgi:GNAT superfamily N-acetyltransferase